MSDPGAEAAVVVTSTPTSDSGHKAKPLTDSCTMYDKPDDDHMVQCDTCNVKCTTAKVKKGNKSRRKNTTKQKLTKTSRKTTTLAATARAAKKGTSKAETNVGDANTKIKAVPVPFISKDLVKPERIQSASKVGSVTSAVSHKSCKARLEVELQQIEAEGRLMQEEMRLKKELSKKKFDVLKELAELEVSDGSIGDQQSNDSKVNNWRTSEQ